MAVRGANIPITRRDFLNGVPIAIGAVAGGLRPATAAAGPALQDVPGYDPPALTGLRGSHPGSFEAAHSLRDGDFWSHAGGITATGETYDLVVLAVASAGSRRRISTGRGTAPRASSFSTTTMISAAMPSATNFSAAAVWS
jgi:spermidine dehydrogenase